MRGRVCPAFPRPHQIMTATVRHHYSRKQFAVTINETRGMSAAVLEATHNRHRFSVGPLPSAPNQTAVEFLIHRFRIRLDSSLNYASSQTPQLAARAGRGDQVFQPRCLSVDCCHNHLCLVRHFEGIRFPTGKKDLWFTHALNFRGEVFSESSGNDNTKQRLVTLFAPMSRLPKFCEHSLPPNEW